MMRSVMLISVAALMAALSGCAVTLHGQQTSGGGMTATTAGSSVQAGARIGHARIGGAFGASPPAHAPGGQVTFSKGASAVLVLAVLIAGVVDEVGTWLRPAEPQTERLPAGSISHTCSCYGWQPELTPGSRPQ